MMGDLARLIAAVDRGEFTDSMFCGAFHRQGLCTECEAAFHGSLDAAKALHEALLPEFRVNDISQLGKPLKWYVVLAGLTQPGYFHANNDNPARAWLLAILRALEAEGWANG